MARIGISGAQSCGKTTLLNDLLKQKEFADYTVCNEVTRTLAKKGFKINEEGNDATQLAIMDVHIENLKNENMLTDRTVLDGYVYTAYLEYKQQVSSETLIAAHKVFIDYVAKYDVIFYVKPEFDIEADGVRSADPDFRADIARIFESVIAQNKPRFVKLVPLTGSPEQRVQQVLKAIKKKAKKK